MSDPMKTFRIRHWRYWNMIQRLLAQIKPWLSITYHDPAATTRGHRPATLTGVQSRPWWGCWASLRWFLTVCAESLPSKFSEMPSEMIYGRKTQIQLTYNSSCGVTQHSNCTLSQTIRHLWLLPRHKTCHFRGLELTCALIMLSSSRICEVDG